MKCVNLLTKILILVGALNWGLVGAFQINLVEKLLGDMTPTSRVVYGLVGLSAIYKMLMCSMKKSCCSTSGKGSCSTGSNSCCR